MKRAGRKQDDQLSIAIETADPPPDGYVRLHLGNDIHDADRRLRAMAEEEVSRRAWDGVSDDIRAAYVRIYGRRTPPTKEHTQGAAARAAISLACGIVHRDTYEDDEREAIQEGL